MDKRGEDLLQEEGVAELALQLRNFSYLLNTVAHDPSAFDRRRMMASLFSIQRQVDHVADKLTALAPHCRSCLDSRLHNEGQVPFFAERHLDEVARADDNVHRLARGKSAS